LGVVEQDLLSWGILERGREGGLSPTRRFRAAMARAAMLLQEEEKAGARPSGHPVLNAVTTALGSYPLPAGAAVERAHIAFVTTIEVESLPPAVRQMLGI
jgi:hypothetical protein